MKLHVSFDTEIPDAAYEAATLPEIREWLKFGLHAGSIQTANPLYDLEVEACYGSVSWRVLPGQESER